MPVKNLRKYFLADNLIESYEWVRGPFQNTPKGLLTAEEEIFIDFTTSGEIKILRISDRGHKKKVKKEIKKAIIKVIIFALLLKQKIKMLLMAAQTFLQFKFLLVAIVYVLSNIVRLWVEIKQKHHPQKVIYYENAHHQHHYEPEHHDHGILEDHGGGWGGIWGRSIAVTPSEQPSPSSPNPTDYFPRSIEQDSILKKRIDAQELVYTKQKPQVKN